MCPSQRDIVEVYFDFPDGRSGPHMVIVLSVREAIDLEEAFIGVVITDSLHYDDEFSFWLRDSMLTRPLNSRSQVRLHLINTFLCKQLIQGKHRNQMKQVDFKERIRRINEMTFGVSFDDE